MLKPNKNAINSVTSAKWFGTMALFSHAPNISKEKKIGIKIRIRRNLSIQYDFQIIGDTRKLLLWNVRILIRVLLLMFMQQLDFEEGLTYV